MRAPSRRLSARLVQALLASTALVGAGPALAQSALPTGGQVVSGGVTIGRPANGALAITQSSQSAIVNWQGFSIGQQNRVDIVQPNASAAILNRVTGTTPSTIAGQLTANGQVYLVNPNGIAITRTGRVNAAGFVASTLDTTDEDFRAGRRQFRGSGASAKATNHGSITIGRGGYAALIGGQVSNAGTISVPMGKVGLGSGERATLDLSGDGFLQVAVPTNAAGRGALVRSSGTISADGGSVILTAAAARDMARQAVNLSGTIEARSVAGRNGSITLSGSDGAVAVSGRLDATGKGTLGKGTAGTGGAVTVTGRDIGLTQARIDVSGRAGGGSVRIGGGRQGGGPLPHAAEVRTDAATTIRADATRRGNGGDVVVWSDASTRFAGTISAKGGARGGDGGQAEVSSKGWLAYSGTTWLTARNGRFGTLLLDPYNVTISNGADTGGLTATGNDSVINATTLTGALASANVTVSTGSSGTQAGNITVAAPVAWSAPTTLTLNAANAIAVNSTISVQGGGGVALTYNAASPTNLSFARGASIDYGATNNGGSLSVNGQGYALVYSMAQLAALGLSGRSALATDLTSTTTYGGSVVPLGYSGTFEGLGHTISNLTISGGGPYLGLFGYTSGTIRDIGLVGGSVSGGDSAVVGALVGLLGQGSAPASVVNAWSSATVSGGNAAIVGGLIGQTYASGGAPTLVANSYSTGAVTTGATIGRAAVAGGLVGTQTAPGDTATISGSYATGTVAGGSNASLGGLVGYNESGNTLGTPRTASIVNSYATGSVGPANAGVPTNSVGGLVGVNTTDAGISTISGSFATGAVSNGGTGSQGGNAAGGLVGANQANGTNGVASITDSFATGAATGQSAARIGGLVGWNLGNGSGAVASIATSYATGRVSTTGYGGIGGLVGTNTVPLSGSATVASSFWDTSTSGTTTGIGGGDPRGQGGNVTGLTTAQLQSGSLPAGFGSGTWATGAGLYPYQKATFANGVQAVSGFAYGDAGATALASGTNGAVRVSVLANGAAFGAATTGANGYYYAIGVTPIAAGQSVLAYTGADARTGATNAATVASAGGTAAQGGLNLYGSTLAGQTSALTFSTLPDLRPAATAAAGGDAAALTAIGLASGRYYVATGSRFTIDQAVTIANTFGVQTTAPGAPITVAAPISIGSGASLGLNAAGALAVNAPVTANGAVSVALGYDTSDAANLSFAIGAPLSFNGVGGALSINGNPYTLITDAAGLQAINAGPTGRYALAADIDASGISGFVPLGTSGAVATNGSNLLNGGKGFTGTFTGLGHIVDGLVVNAPQTQYVGLFGYVGTGGLVQNVGVTNADLRGVGSLGGIAGHNAGTVTQSYATGQVYATASGQANAPAAANSTGGLIGRNAGLLSNSFTTVTVNARDTNQAGGAVGTNDFATIDRVAATGAVDIGTGGSSAGGLVGYNFGVSFIAGSGVVINSFATGAVSGGVNIGSFIGNNLSSSPVSGAYDATTGRAYTAFQPGSSGIGGGTASGSVVGLSTADLQNGGASGLSAAYGGGANGLYPYLKSFYPNGVQAISGIAYRNGATDVLSSSVGRPINVPDAGRVSVMANGKVLDTVSTGANGYYYVAAPAGTLAANAPVLAYTVANASSGASNAATVVAATGGATLAGVTLYGSTLSGTVGDTVLSSAGPSLVAAANAAAGSNTAASSAIADTAGRNFIATGAGFTIDRTVSTSGLFGVQTIAANAPITVAKGITVNGADTLQLQASGALALQASVSVPGAGKVALAASLDTTTAPGVSLLNLSFAPGTSINYGATNNGGTLSINGQSYGLLYAMSDLAGINGSLGGRYALATDLNAGGTTYTSAVIAPGRAYTNPAFTGTLTGLGHAIANLAIANTADQMGVGLIGINSGTVRDLRLVGGSVSTTGIGTGNTIGALVGNNLGGTIANVASSTAVSGGTGALYAGGLVGSSDGSSRSVAIVNASATGSVLVSGGTAGGLVGLQQGTNSQTATIANSFATGQVTSTAGFYAGGLVGISQAVDGGTARIADSFATGMVSVAGSFSQAGGLVGQNLGVRSGAVASLTNVYATGVVNGPNSGGLIGSNLAVNGGVTTLTNAYWNTTTSGRQTGIGTDDANVSVTGLTTAQLQSGTLPGGFSSGLWSTGIGLYPYLTSFFPNGVQAVSGTVYADAGATPLASGGTVTVIGNGARLGSATTGADGSYYVFGGAGTLGAGNTLLATGVSASGARNAATLTSAVGGLNETGLDLYGNALTIPTMATSLSSAPSLSDAQTTARAAAGGDAAALAAINGAGGRGFVAGGASFTIDQPISGANTFTLRMIGASAGITVSQPVTIASGGSLGLLATGALKVNAPITINGAGTANLAYDSSNPTNLTFAPGAPLTFANADGSAATGAVTGQALSVNGRSYGLLYTMGDLDSVNGNLAGRYALARDLDASGHSYTSAVIAAGYANSDPAFTGILTGLGHAIANLSIANTTTSTSVGLIGNNSGTIRDLALLGGTVASNAGGTVTGALVGYNLGGTIANVSSSASVSGGIGVNSTGGLVGYSDGATRDVVIVNASSTGSVIVSDGYAGGLVGVQKGNNGHSATIANSFATGQVRTNGQYAGGLVGLNQTLDGGTATIANSFATGAVDAAGQAGGLVGYNQSGRGGAVALLTEVYATGLVSGPNSGGLVGGNTAFGGGVTTLTNAYWNTTTSGRQTGIGTNDANVSVTGLTTAQLQSGTLPGGFSSGRWSTGSGLYPYLTSFFPNGIQVVTGTVYADAGVTPASPRTVGVIAGGTPFGSASSGADGSYYAFGQPGTIANGVALLVHNGANGATLTAATGAALQGGVDLYGNAVTVTTAANALSAAPSLADARASASASAGGDATALAAIAAARGRSFLVSGGDFAIDQAVSTGDTFRVQTTTANAAITVSNAITLADGASLGLLASGALRFNAPVTANGAVSVNLAYDPSALANLDFAAGRALTYTDAAGRATATDAGGRLTINGQGYTLLYSMADLDGIDGIAASANGINPQAAGTTGFYALANDLNAAGTPYADALVSKSLGVIEGLNHSITGLTIAKSGRYAGLVGQNMGTLRDLALVGGSVSGDSDVGALAGGNFSGRVFNVVSSATVTGNGSVGGLIGLMNGGRVSRSAATGDVVGTGLSGPVGGLIGSLNGATVTQSYATGNVTLSVLSPVAVGGLIGASTGSSIAQVSAGGAVLSLGVGSSVGGLIGSSSGDTIDQATATGAVIASSGSSSVGGLIGVATALALTNGFYDAQTAGVASNGVGTALTTAQLQGALPGGFDGAVWSTGSGLYPYLTAFFPDGVQAVSGLVTKADGTPLASGANGLGLVTIASDGRVVGRVATGANGAYYSLVKAGPLASGNGVAAFTTANAGTGAADAITYAGGLPSTLTRLDLSGGWRRDGTGLTTLSALDAGFGATVAGTAAATLAPGSRAIEAAGAFALDTALAVADTLALNVAGAVTQTGLVTAPNLRVITPDAVTLTLAANRIGTVAANAARLDLANVGALTIGRVADATGSILSGVTTAGALKVATDGSLTIAVGAGARGADPLLAATGAFVNQGGPGAVSATSGRWLIYSGDPADDSFGGLDSRNTAVWNTAAGGGVSVGGDRYVFAKPQSLTVTSTDADKIYGEDVSAALAGHFTVGGFAAGVAGAFLADTAATAFSGTALVTSAGAAATARVGAAPYAITVARGTLTSETGYGFTFVDAGRLTVAARSITITADAQGRVYGD
ncbi:beta strand repeat-containing protein, partial [Methylorubrum podarium]|uniref:beta strand repeat-containing protein n=1 Tax=Methylorubrum podarium TaxID=200476 RepID=UPI001EE1867A